jgi:hypothetical protein
MPVARPTIPSRHLPDARYKSHSLSSPAHRTMPTRSTPIPVSPPRPRRRALRTRVLRVAAASPPETPSWEILLESAKLPPDSRLVPAARLANVAPGVSWPAGRRVRRSVSLGTHPRLSLSFALGVPAHAGDPCSCAARSRSRSRYRSRSRPLSAAITRCLRRYMLGGRFAIVIRRWKRSDLQRPSRAASGRVSEVVVSGCLLQAR